MRFERLARSLGAFVVLFLLAGGSSEAQTWPLCARVPAQALPTHTLPNADRQRDAPIERPHHRDIRTHVLNGSAEY